MDLCVDLWANFSVGIARLRDTRKRTRKYPDKAAAIHTSPTQLIADCLLNLRVRWLGPSRLRRHFT